MAERLTDVAAYGPFPSSLQHIAEDRDANWWLERIMPMGAAGGWGFVALLLIFSLLWFLSLLPYGMEVMRRSKNFDEYRNRLREMGPLGDMIAGLSPRRRDRLPLVRFWGTLCHLSLGGILALCILAVATGFTPADSPSQRVRALIIAVGSVGGFWLLQSGILRLGQIFERHQEQVRHWEAAEQSIPVKAPGEPSLLALEDPSASPKPEPAAAAPSAVRSALGFALTLAAVIAIRVVSDHLGPLQSFHKTLSLYRMPLIVLMVSLTGLGFLLTFGPLFLGLLAGEGRAMTRDEQIEMSRRNVRLGRGAWSVVRFSGEMWGRQVADASSFAYLKQGLRSGAWGSDPQWRRWFLIWMGAMLMIFAGFSIVIVAGPAWVMLWIGPILLYAAAWLLWGFIRA